VKEKRETSVIIKKQYPRRNPLCRVTFKLPGGKADFAKTAHLVGDFNGWNIWATPMKKSKNGIFTATINLERGREYEFLYLIDKKHWELDEKADKYVRSHFGDCDISVVVV
jgi:1,4-alpha-glucan branching enzyme